MLRVQDSLYSIWMKVICIKLLFCMCLHYPVPPDNNTHSIYNTMCTVASYLYPTCKTVELFILLQQPYNSMCIYNCCMYTCIDIHIQTFRPKKKWEKGTLKYDLHKKAKVGCILNMNDKTCMYLFCIYIKKQEFLV